MPKANEIASPKKLTVLQASIAKQELKRKIEGALDEFLQQTGLCVHSIDFNLYTNFNREVKHAVQILVRL